MQTQTTSVEAAHEALLTAQRRERIAREGYRLATQAAQAAVAHRRHAHAYDEMHAQAEAHHSTARERDLLDAAQQAVTDAEADLRQAVQTAVNRTRDDYRPAYRDALEGVCQAMTRSTLRSNRRGRSRTPTAKPPRPSPCAEAGPCPGSGRCRPTSTGYWPGATPATDLRPRTPAQGSSLSQP